MIVDEGRASLLFIFLCLRDVTEDVRESVRDDSLRLRRVGVAHHRVGLSSASLSIRQNRSIVALEHFIDDRARRVDVQVDLK